MGYKFYNKDGVQTGYSVEEGSGCLPVLALCIGLYSIVWSFDWVVNKLTLWQTYSAPYNYISLYYYKMFESPISFISFVFDWAKNLQLTIYPNINGIIGLIIPLMLIVSVIIFIWQMFIQENSICRYLKWLMLACIFAPVIVITFWYFIEIIYYWLIKTE